VALRWLALLFQISTPAVARVAVTNESTPFRRRLLDETWSAIVMVSKFMALAFFLEALINLYVPSEWFGRILKPGGVFLKLLVKKEKMCTISQGA
jgi:uncharacterized membrane protein YraQ (UPF0718 family)